MPEIYGGNLTEFFKNNEFDARCTFASTDQYGSKHEIWEISENTLKAINDMSEDEWDKLAGDKAWYRYAEGSNKCKPFQTVYVNGSKMKGWVEHNYTDKNYVVAYESLRNYLAEEIGASQPRNIVALAVDLAKANHTSLAGLFQKYWR